MAVTPTKIQLAAQGWDYASWQADFYPPDLPIDWRLSYYSNEFRAVIIPAAVWAVVDTGEIQAWVEETHGDFLFYPEVVAIQTDWIQFARKAQLLGAQLGGILLQARAGQGDIQKLVSSFRQAAAIAPSCMLLAGDRRFTATEKIMLTERGVELAWNIKNPENDDLQAERATPLRHGQGTLAVIQLTANTSCSPRKLRDIIETGLRRDARRDNSQLTGDRTMLLMFEGEAADIGTMRAAGIIGDLLETPFAE